MASGYIPFEPYAQPKRGERRKIWVTNEHSFVLRNRFIVPASEDQRVSEIRTDDPRQRVQLFCTPHLAKTIVKPFHARQVGAEPMMCGRVIRFDFDRAAIFLFGAIPIPFIIRKVKAERGVCFCQESSISNARRAAAFA